MQTIDLTKTTCTSRCSIMWLFQVNPQAQCDTSISQVTLKAINISWIITRIKLPTPSRLLCFLLLPFRSFFFLSFFSFSNAICPDSHSSCRVNTSQGLAIHPLSWILSVRSESYPNLHCYILSYPFLGVQWLDQMNVTHAWCLLLWGCHVSVQ